MICCCCCFNLGGCLECCSGISPKTCQAIKITNSVIKLILLGISIYIIDWEKIPKINFILFLVLSLFVFISFILGFLLCCLTNVNNIKANKKTAVQNIMTTGTVFTALILILCIIEEIILTISFIKCKEAYPCYEEGEEYEVVSTKVYVGFFFFKKNHTNYSQISKFDNFNQIKRRISSNETDGNNYETFCYNTFLTSYVYAVAYVSFSVIEIICFVGCCFWASSKNIYTSEEIITKNYSSQNNANQSNQNKNNYQNNNRPQININNPQIIFVNQGNNNQPTNQQKSYNQNNKNIK